MHPSRVSPQNRVARIKCGPRPGVSQRSSVLHGIKFGREGYMCESLTLSHLKEIAGILSSSAVCFGVIITWWYASSWYKQYLYGRRDKVFGNLELALKTAFFATEDLCILMHRDCGTAPQQAIDFLGILMKTYKECRSKWMDFQLAGSAASPFISHSSRMHLVRANEHVMPLRDTFKGAVERFIHSVLSNCA